MLFARVCSTNPRIVLDCHCELLLARTMNVSLAGSAGGVDQSLLLGCRAYNELKTAVANVNVNGSQHLTSL